MNAFISNVLLETNLPTWYYVGMGLVALSFVYQKLSKWYFQQEEDDSKCPNCESKYFYFQVSSKSPNGKQKVKFCKSCKIEFQPRRFFD